MKAAPRPKLQDETKPRRRHVFVLEAGKLHFQENRAEQFEQSLQRRMQKLLAPDRLVYWLYHSVFGNISYRMRNLRTFVILLNCTRPFLSVI
ncbi:predicted protein [Coccidioides posadasii str. Silveira]|uniref:Predicted protein n=1 Tax=Coccidioides posadasii (strain RMSCC 757 / Silveira) TaxID=443226 RepID=E9DCU9_COCPS|nr:predicted protein [Coccidioides posadasii str. Silveira]